MLSQDSYNKIRSLAEEVSAREGCKLYDLQFVGHKGGRVLRVYVDSPPDGVSVDQCANISRGLSLLLDVEDLVAGGTYDLEISSPGVERELRLPWHYSSAIGEKIRVRTKQPVSAEEATGKMAQVKQVVGELASANEVEIVVKSTKETWKVPLAVIHRANVVFDYETHFSKNKKKSKNKK